MLNKLTDSPQRPLADRAYRGEIIRVFTPEIGNHATGNHIAMLARIRFCRTLPSTSEGRCLGGQLFDSGTSVGSNYRAVCRARSRADFIAKLGIVIEEADESEYWLDVITATSIMPSGVTRTLRQEALELVAIFTASQKTARENSKT